MYKGNVFFVILLCVTAALQQTHAQNFDLNLLKKINATETGFKNWYLEGAASSVTVTSIGVPVSTYIIGLVKHDKKLQEDGMYMAGGYLFSAALTQTIKRIVDRKRPFETYTFIIKRDDEDEGRSFPSGHTSAAFCTATGLALRYRQWYVIVPSYLFAGSVAWARMYQGVHYPSDVFAGALLGAGSAWLGWKFQQWRDRKSSKSKNAAIPGTPRF
jgi:membrane-associated phospholipid phosphatase